MYLKVGAKPTQRFSYLLGTVAADNIRICAWPRGRLGCPITISAPRPLHTKYSRLGSESERWAARRQDNATRASAQFEILPSLPTGGEWVHAFARRVMDSVGSVPGRRQERRAEARAPLARSSGILLQVIHRLEDARQRLQAPGQAGPAGAPCARMGWIPPPRRVRCPPPPPWCA
ncbi:hypothetical protein CC78DRAFT_576881 [Lojkania enalia]|uniref:Uncharacterized protein n=1 Tax=Lojkania enalia TaxID=147567 RepID=A0A9P4KGY7_9PLEO|nr:hypothetical protein CC78DRAFT_576881 [Didymosphaeria enalia]